MKECDVSLDVPATGKHGRYPIHIAAMCGSMNMFKLLVGYQIKGTRGDVLTADNTDNLTRKDNNNGKHSRYFKSARGHGL